MIDDHDKPPPVPTEGGGSSLDPTDPKVWAMIRLAADRNPRWRMTDQRREMFLAALVDALQKTDDPKVTAQIVRTAAVLERMNQIDQLTAMKIASEQQIANTPRQVIHWTDPPRPSIEGKQ